MNKTKSSENRILALEGVRGIAAIMVVVFHVLISFFPAVYYSPAMGVKPHVGFDANIFGSIPYALINGRFAVGIFFILSGFVLSIGFFTAKTKKEAQAKNLNQALKRYLRLMIPAFASVMIAWLVLALGLNFNQQAYAITGSIRLDYFWSFDPNFFAALYQGLIGIFHGQDWYNQPLWAMRWEFIGSFFVFALLGLFGRTKIRYVVYAIGLVALLHTFILGFLIGVIIADVYAQQKFPKLKLWQGIGLIVFGLVFGAVNSYSDIGLSGFLLGIDAWAFLWYFVGATLVIIAVLHTPKISNKLATPKMITLGKNTFSLYVLHDILILSVMSFVFVKLQPNIGYMPAFLVALCVFCAVLVPATIIFTKYVDALSVNASRGFAIKAQPVVTGVYTKIRKHVRYTKR